MFEALPKDWAKHLDAEFEKDYMKELESFLLQEQGSGKLIYPKASEIFSAFHLTPLNKVRVVVLGQDPYHGAGQAHGSVFQFDLI